MASNSRRNVKHNIPICVACILLCLTLISIYLSSGLYARYVTSIGGNDSARVIRFGDITLTEDAPSPLDSAENFIIIPGVNITKRPIVSFAGSEAATYVFIEIQLSNHWETSDNVNFSIHTNDLKWKLADGWTLLSAENNTYVYFWSLPPNIKLTADIIGNGGQIIVSNTLTASELSALNDVYINLHAVAVQANGFASASDAWDAVSAP